MPTIKKALVPGAGGFIGHHFVRRLIDEGVEVAAFIRYTSNGHHGLLERLPQEYQGAYEAHLGDLRDFEAVRRASEVERLIASNELAKELCGWTPTVSLEDGLAHTIAWMQDNADLQKLRGYVI